ncbi:MAG: hypothetical protein LBV78_24805 [Kitasatospora sp.]|jgi:hypothetical protein|nr:hypothetical protein [Kitasatospora sp.]
MSQRRSTGRAARVARGLWPDRNPLRRTLDRVESLIVAVLAVAFLAGVPLAAFTAEHISTSIGTRTARAEQAARHHVTAVLQATAPAVCYPRCPPPVRARWTAPDGTARTGMVTAQPGQRAGSTVLVWADAAGRLTAPPLTAVQVRDQAVMVAVATAMVLGLLVWCAGELAHYLLGRRRMAAWDAEWRAIGPKWTSRR